MNVATNTLSIALRNDEYEYHHLGETLDAFTKLNAFPEEERRALQSCIDKVIATIIEHGFDDIDGHKIDVRLQFRLDTRNLMVWIVDNGRKLMSCNGNSRHDPGVLLQTHSPNPPSIRSVKEYGDQVSYRRQSGCNHLILSKRVARVPEASAAEPSA